MGRGLRHLMLAFFRRLRRLQHWRGITGRGVGSAARITAAGSGFFVAGSELLARETELLLLLVLLRLLLLVLLPRSGLRCGISRRFGVGRILLAGADFAGGDRRCSSLTGSRADRIGVHEDWLKGFVGVAALLRRFTACLTRVSRCSPTAAGIDKGTLQPMHAMRQKEIVSYRHTPKILRDVILLPHEFHVRFSSSKSRLVCCDDPVNTGYFHRSVNWHTACLGFQLQRWTHYLSSRQAGCAPACRSWTFSRIISQTRRAAVIRRIAEIYSLYSSPDATGTRRRRGANRTVDQIDLGGFHAGNHRAHRQSLGSSRWSARDFLRSAAPPALSTRETVV